MSYVYDLPFYRHGSGSMVERLALANWQLSGITSVQTGTPFSIRFTGFSDNAGVANSLGIGSFPDLDRRSTRHAKHLVRRGWNRRGGHVPLL